MNDLISRQAAIDKINERQRKLIYCFGFENDMVKTMDIARSIIIAMPSAQPEHNPDDERKSADLHKMVNYLLSQPEQRWIPCSERLPEPNEEDGRGFIKAYLVQDARWMDVARWDGDSWIAWGYGTRLENVTAWKPLPEPWRGK